MDKGRGALTAVRVDCMICGVKWSECRPLHELLNGVPSFTIPYYDNNNNSEIKSSI